MARYRVLWASDEAATKVVEADAPPAGRALVAGALWPVRVVALDAEVEGARAWINLNHVRAVVEEPTP